MHALKWDALAPIANVGDAAPPFQYSRCLITHYPGTKIESMEAHGSVISPRKEKVLGAV